MKNLNAVLCLGGETVTERLSIVCEHELAQQKGGMCHPSGSVAGDVHSCHRRCHCRVHAETAPILFGPNLDYRSTNKGTIIRGRSGPVAGLLGRLPSTFHYGSNRVSLLVIL